MSTSAIVARSRVLAAVLAWAGSDAAAWEVSLDDETAPDSAWSHAGENGPDRWGRLSPEFSVCATGRLQSPVALDSGLALSESCRPLRFRYRSSSLYATNDGNALRLGYDRGSFLLIDGLSYELVEARFHVPGEHLIDRRLPDGELQLIHGNNRGDVAIVAVQLVAGQRSNQILRRVLDHAPSVAGEQYHGRNVGVNALFLIPGRQDYFAYQGSLTRPPCSEGVRWYVIREPLEVDSADLRRLAQLVGPNARPMQALNGRQVVYACGEP